MARDEKLVIRLPLEVKEEFKQIAEEMGMTMSTLGSYCIGKFLREERNKNQVQDKMLDSVMPMFKEQLDGLESNPEVQKIAMETIKKMFPNNQQ